MLKPNLGVFNHALGQVPHHFRRSASPLYLSRRDVYSILGTFLTSRVAAATVLIVSEQKVRRILERIAAIFISDGLRLTGRGKHLRVTLVVGLLTGGALLKPCIPTRRPSSLVIEEVGIDIVTV